MSSLQRRLFIRSRIASLEATCVHRPSPEMKICWIHIRAVNSQMDNNCDSRITKLIIMV